MKKFITAMLLATFTATVQGQQPNPRLTQLDEFLQQQEKYFQHTQTNAQEGSITHYLHGSISGFNYWVSKWADTTPEEWKQRVLREQDSINAQTWQRVDKVLDSIRMAFACLGKEASESYMYEYHKNGTDTIKYSLAFQRGNDTLFSSRINNQVYFWNEKEFAQFDYYRPPLNDHGAVQALGNYHHKYFIPNGISHDDLQPLDTIAFSQYIQPVMKKFKKLKGTKTYPVHWQHDDGFEPGHDFFSYGYVHFGLCTGTHYIIPSEHENEVEALYRQLDSLVYNYVNVLHPEQNYEYTFTTHFPHLVHEDIVKGRSSKENEEEYYLCCVREKDDNYHIFTLRSRGTRWIPYDWTSLKSYINGKKVYIKGMEPKKEKEEIIFH